MIVNRQNKEKVDLVGARAFEVRLRRVLGLDDRGFNVCFVDDRQIRKLNFVYRGKHEATDVLSFPWGPSDASDGHSPGGELTGFLGDVVISVETARRQARAEGQPASTEISWLILHGLLHLLGMDHENDRGEMAALELDLRARLAVEGSSPPPKSSRAQGRNGPDSARSKPRLKIHSKAGLKVGTGRAPSLRPPDVASQS